MSELILPDSHHVEAAQGWCELHAFLEADAELDQIEAKHRAHPSVLEVRWRVYANLEKWEGALEIASALVMMRPDWANGWIYKASSMTELNRHQEAYDTLLDAVEMFPSDGIILYDLACVGCALKRPDEARMWLIQAIEAGGNEIKLRALDDPDLELVWDSLKAP